MTSNPHLHYEAPHWAKHVTWNAWNESGYARVKGCLCSVLFHVHRDKILPYLFSLSIQSTIWGENKATKQRSWKNHFSCSKWNGNLRLQNSRSFNKALISNKRRSYLVFIRFSGLSCVSTAWDLNREAKWRENMAARKQVGRVRNRNRHCYLTYDQNFRNLWHNESNPWPSIFRLTVISFKHVKLAPHYWRAITGTRLQ